MSDAFLRRVSSFPGPRWLAGSGAALHLPRGELLARDGHLGGAQIEDLEHVGLVVLRGEAEQPAAPLQPGQRSLQREVALG